MKPSVNHELPTVENENENEIEKIEEMNNDQTQSTEIQPSTPQEKSKELEYEIEKTLANCPEGQIYDFDYKRCIYKSSSSSSVNFWTLDKKPVYQSPTKAIQQAIQKKGPRYYDWSSRSYKFCEYGEVYNYRSRGCVAKSEGKRYSFFG